MSREAISRRYRGLGRLIMITGIIIRGVRSGGYQDERACTLVEPRR